MNGKQARRIRKQIYSGDLTHRYRRYTIGDSNNRIADDRRQAYQHAKQAVNKKVLLTNIICAKKRKKRENKFKNL